MAKSSRRRKYAKRGAEGMAGLAVVLGIAAAGTAAAVWYFNKQAAATPTPLPPSGPSQAVTPSGTTVPR